MWAASEGHSEIVRQLIGRGANVKAVSKAGFTPLMFASVRNDVPSLKALLAAGADPNAALPDGTKVLAVAAAWHSTAAAGALLDAGADPATADRNGNTLLHNAAQLGDIGLMQRLLARGVDVNVRTPLAPAAGAGRRGAAAGGGFFRPQAGAQTPLMLAARAGQIEAMKTLLAAGADPKLKADDGSTFLMAAVGSAQVEAVRFAWDYDNDIHAVTNNGTTLIHASVSGTANGATQEAQDRVCGVIGFLASKGAALDEINAAGRTAIDLADGLPIDKAVDLLTQLILKTGKKPRSPSKR